MRIIDRYILKKFLSTYVFVVLILVAIIVIIDITERNDKFIKHQLTLVEILPYYLAFIPYISNLITPITVFIATVFVTSKMASHTEIIAILSSGVSFRRLMVPYIIGSVIIGVISFFLNGWIIPEANKTRIAFQIQYLKKPYYFTERNIHIKVAPHEYIYMQSYNSNASTGFRFTLEKIGNNRLIEKLSANRIEWDSTQNNWKLKNWDHRIILEKNEIVTSGVLLDTAIDIHPKDFTNTYGLHETLTNKELQEFIELLKLRGDEGVAFYEIELYVRYMAPFAALILTLMGLIVSSRKSRGGAGFQIALGFLLAFIYIILFIMSRAIADAGSINPVLGIWLPNIIFSAVGVILYHTVPR